MAAAVSFTMHDCIAYDTAVENKFRGQVGKCLIDVIVEVESRGKRAGDLSGLATNQELTTAMHLNCGAVSQENKKC
jgi:hypothetical protein